MTDMYPNNSLGLATPDPKECDDDYVFRTVLHLNTYWDRYLQQIVNNNDSALWLIDYFSALESEATKRTTMRLEARAQRKLEEQARYKARRDAKT